MKKIGRLSFDKLSDIFVALKKEEQRRFVGGYSDGGSGCGYDWFVHGHGFTDSNGNFYWYRGYTQEELNNWEGTWYGGWVYGLGYVAPDTIVYPNSYGSGYNFDIYSAVGYLTDHAAANSTGYCARAVRMALEAGGLSTDGRPGSATDYETFLSSIGFSVVDTANYIPQVGDIVVHEATSGHPYGHIAMYNGEKWVSDFEQRDMFGGSAYRTSNNYTILRWSH